MRNLMIAALALVAALFASAVEARGNQPLFAVPEADKARTDLATLVLPVALDLDMVDGLTYPGFRNMFRKGDIQVKVLPGEREVALRYNQVFRVDADNHEVVKSKLIVVKFVAEPGKVYRAVHPAFRNVDEARAGMQNFVVRIDDEQGANRVVAASQVQVNWKGESTTTTRKDLVSPEAAAAVAASAPAIAAPAAPAAAGGVNAVELLKFTWQNASAADRAAFLEWVKANP